MLLTRIEAVGFRNLAGSIEFGLGINILYGDNAQGKTNWLEAICVLGTTRSFRTSQLRDCIGFSGQQAIVRGEVKRGSLSKQIQVALTDSTREQFVNAKREPLSRYLGNLAVFVFSLEDMDVVRGEPAERRRFLDQGITSLTPAYVNTLSEYNRVVRQKNRLLVEASASDDPKKHHDQIEAWNDQQVTLGAAIHSARVTHVTRLNQALESSEGGRAVFGAERISLRYVSQLEGKGDLGRYEELYAERLRLRLPAEVAAGHCLIGPHRDELEILSDGRPLARFGSAGQQRSALFLLDLAQVSLYTSSYEESPILVIDDVDAELDRGRIEALVSQLEGRVQTFISTSRRGVADRYRGRASVYYIEAGRADRADIGRERKQA